MPAAYFTTPAGESRPCPSQRGAPSLVANQRSVEISQTWSKRGYRWKRAAGKRTTRALRTLLSRSVSHFCLMRGAPQRDDTDPTRRRWRVPDREEGFKAFFKGGPARIVRSSPQFGFTLVAYEYLHKVRLIFGGGEAREADHGLGLAAVCAGKSGSVT